MKELARIVAASALAVVSLSGCSTWRSAVNYIAADNSNVCPDAAILANTASLPAFDPAKAADPSSVIYNIAMTNVKTRCDYSKRENKADSNLSISYTATRPPGGAEAHYRVPYYVAVTSGGEIVDKQIHWLEFDFPQAASRVSGESYVDSVDIAIDRQKRSYEYHLLIGFQLTQAQLDYNKKMGQFAP
jgi:hypothetical protein